LIRGGGGLAVFGNKYSGLPSNSYKPITNTAWVRALGTPASSTTKTGRHDIAEILLKVALNTINKYNQTDFVFVGSTRSYCFQNRNKNNLAPRFPSLVLISASLCVCLH
jgi:hypothetical protein